MPHQGFVHYRLPQKQESIYWEGEWIYKKKEESHSGVFCLNTFDDLEGYWILEPSYGRINEQHITDLKDSYDEPISKKSYEHQVKQAAQEIRETNLSKVVLSRIENINHKIDSNLTFVQLTAQYTNAFCYRLYHPHYGYWMGASPETLIQQNNNQFQTMALAGTLSSSSKAEWSEKEIEEQAFVKDEILKLLKQKKIQPYIHERETIKAGSVRHLRNMIEFEDDEHSIIAIAKLLHPTSAVCGIPREKALKYIQKTEQHQRKLYTGFIGPLGEHESQLFVNLRCMQVFKNNVSLYIGGGITGESIPQKEWEETVLKSETMKKILVHA